MVKNKERSKKTYNGTKKTMKARIRREEAREQKQIENEVSRRKQSMKA